MGIIKEPLDIDFVVDSRPLTKKEKLAISEFIKADKAKRALSEKTLPYLNIPFLRNPDAGDSCTIKLTSPPVPLSEREGVDMISFNNTKWFQQGFGNAISLFKNIVSAIPRLPAGRGSCKDCYK